MNYSYVHAVVEGVSENHRRSVKYNPNTMRGEWHVKQGDMTRKRVIPGTVFLGDIPLFVPTNLADRHWIRTKYSPVRQSYKGVKRTELQEYAELQEEAA